MGKRTAKSLWRWLSRSGRSRRPEPASRKPRTLLLESLEPRQLLSGLPLGQTLAQMLAKMTPHPTGPSHTSSDLWQQQAVLLCNYNPSSPPPVPSALPGAQDFLTGFSQVESSILNNPEARPDVWGQTSGTGGGQYQLDLDANGMLITFVDHQLGRRQCGADGRGRAVGHAPVRRQFGQLRDQRHRHQSDGLVLIWGWHRRHARR